MKDGMDWPEERLDVGKPARTLFQSLGWEIKRATANVEMDTKDWRKWSPTANGGTDSKNNGYCREYRNAGCWWMVSVYYYRVVFLCAGIGWTCGPWPCSREEEAFRNTSALSPTYSHWCRRRAKLERCAGRFTAAVRAQPSRFGMLIPREHWLGWLPS